MIDRLSVCVCVVIIGVELEIVTTCKHLGIVVDESLSFKSHIEKPLSKLKMKLFVFLEKQVLFFPTSLELLRYLC